MAMQLAGSLVGAASVSSPLAGLWISWRRAKQNRQDARRTGLESGRAAGQARKGKSVL